VAQKQVSVCRQIPVHPMQCGNLYPIHLSEGREIGHALSVKFVLFFAEKGPQFLYVLIHF